MAQAEKTVSYRATETLTRPGRPTVRVRVQRAAHNRRYDYLAPDLRRGDAVIDDGKSVWVYLSGDKAAVQTVSRPSREYTIRPGLQASVSGASRVDNRAAWVLQLARGVNQRRLWIDQKNGTVLKRELRRGTALLESSTLSGIRFGKVPATTFVWTPPAGTKISRSAGTFYVSANAARRLAMLKFPAWIPGGYSFESAIVDDKKGEAWLRFSGAKRFSIFQSRTQHDASLQQVDGAWFLARGGNRFVIVGLEEADARKLAGGL